MPEVTLEQAPQKVKDLFNRGFVAMERGNLDYAIDMFTACLQMEPNLHRARKFMRAAEIKQFKAKGDSAFARATASVTSLPAEMAITVQLRSGKAAQALQAIEKLMRRDPTNKRYLNLLDQAAEALGELEISIQTLDMARELHPNDAHIVERLGHLYMKTNQPRQGRECFELLCTLRPNDGAALKALKDAMAIDSMTKDGWAETAATGGSFRNMIRDQKVAETLEREQKAVKGQSDVEALIAENRARIQREPGNVNYRRALAALFASNQMFTDAIKTLEEAQTVAGGRDPQIDQSMTAIRIQAFDQEIRKLKEAGIAAAVSAKEAERDRFIFLDLQDRVARYPTDLVIKHDYGVLLYQQNQINEAIQQFQAAQRNAQKRVSSLYYIGLCFKAKQQYDLAIEQFQKAAAEVQVMDDQKKSALYELGATLEKVNRLAEAMECFKQIYQIDIGYRDVAARVEHGYKPAP